MVYPHTGPNVIISSCNIIMYLLCVLGGRFNAYVAVLPLDEQNITGGIIYSCRGKVASRRRGRR